MKASIAESFVGLLKEMYILFLIQPLVFVDKKEIVTKNTNLSLSNIRLYFVDLSWQTPISWRSHTPTKETIHLFETWNYFIFLGFRGLFLLFRNQLQNTKLHYAAS
jgi:hypothetical protein